jgi:micrococcal nuclease
MKKRGWIVAGAVMLIVIGIAAHQFGWVKPVDPKTFLKYEPGSYAVKAFNDGDTIVVDMNGTDETVRFIGVDTPETHKPNSPVQCYGPEASVYTKKRIGTSRVRLVADRLTTNRDRYDRLLRYVVLEDGTYLNKELIEKGYAFAYDFPFARNQEFHDAMDATRADKKGLWSSCQPYQDPATGQWHSNDTSETGV